MKLSREFEFKLWGSTDGHVHVRARREGVIQRRVIDIDGLNRLSTAALSPFSPLRKGEYLNSTASSSIPDAGYLPTLQMSSAVLHNRCASFTKQMR
jgi:hypothetical protein